ncbi:MAG: J domain-containing protein [Alphaproteobacteria bacterium]|nr:J domain-containing protein [Alphaproteobacteria bacterium]MBU0858681.1 J domain-containing protein [Alphaproteobacteria bacterium]
MASTPSHKPPHEILGVTPDADILELSLAFSKLAKRWNPETNPGDELAAQRFKRINAAFEEMCRAQGFKAMPDPLHDQQVINFAVDGFNFPVEPPRVETKEDKIRNFHLRARVGQLVQRWNLHMKFVNDRDRIVDEIKAEQGDRFTHLKAIFRRSAEDKTLWAAERYLRSGGEAGLGGTSLRTLAKMVSAFQSHMNFRSLHLINEMSLEMVEEELDLRISQTDQALEIMRHQRPYIDFHVR